MSEVAHDMQHQVSRFVSADLKMVNSFDTWHGKFIYGVLVRGDHFQVFRCHRSELRLFLFFSFNDQYCCSLAS